MAALPWHPDRVLSSLRNHRGEPNLRVRVLAVVVAVLMLGPGLALLLLRGVATLLPW